MREKEKQRALTDDLKHGMSGGRFAFDLNGQDAEQKNLHGCAGGVPASAKCQCQQLHQLPCRSTW